MPGQWYFARRGKTDGPACLDELKIAASGPISAARLLELAASGALAAGDWVWTEGTDVQITVAQFLAMARAGTLPPGEPGARPMPSGPQAAPPTDNVLPDWLAEVAQNEAATRLATPFVPDWFKDVQESESGALPPPGIPLDWLEDIRQIEESLRSPAPPARAAQPAAEAPSAPPPPSPRPAPPPPTPSVGPELNGFDPDTGRILDPAAYALWQRAQAQRRQDDLLKQPTVSVAEAFLDAQRALQEWVDACENRPLVTDGDMEVIRNCPSVLDLMRRYEGYGPVMQEKLWQRLALLVDNRRKFLKAFCC